MTEPLSSIPAAHARVHSSFRQSLQDIAAGTVGGICTVLVGHPLDTIKVRLQTGGAPVSMTDCIRLTVEKEGWRGFYKGMQSPLAGEGFFNAVQFLSYGYFKRLLLQRTEGVGVPSLSYIHAPGGARVTVSERTDLTVSEYFAAGALTGFACTFIETPIDLFKSQLQTQIYRPKPLFTTFPQSLQYVWKESGLRGVYQGMTSTFIRTIPGTAFYFGVYEGMKQFQLRPGQKKSELGPAQLLLAGGCGGTAYWVSSFPFDTIKSAMQSDAIRPSERKYASWMDCARKLYAEGGVARFYRGITPCLLRSFPANAACFYAYEVSLKFLDSL
jgi:solute carrier family 25 carnitine/acylcarnitine transporter 20/29